MGYHPGVSGPLWLQWLNSHNPSAPDLYLRDVMHCRAITIGRVIARIGSFKEAADWMFYTGTCCYQCKYCMNKQHKSFPKIKNTEGSYWVLDPLWIGCRKCCKNIFLIHKTRLMTYRGTAKICVFAFLSYLFLAAKVQHLLHLVKV